MNEHRSSLPRRGYTQTRNSVAWNARLSLSARTVHTLLLDLAFKATKDPSREVYESIEFPLTEQELAASVGRALNGLSVHVQEPGVAARVVATSTRGRPQVRC